MKSTIKKSLQIIVTIIMMIIITMPTTAYAASKKPVTITCIKSGTTITTDSTKSLQAKTNVSSKLTYVTSNKKIATIKNGKIIAYRTGTITITIKATPKSKKYKTTSKKIKINIIPSTVTIATQYKGSNIILSAKKINNASGYQFQYATTKNMSNAKTKTQKSTIFNLKGSTKNYYVRCRAYTTVNKKNYYGPWCKTIRTKKLMTNKLMTNKETGHYETVVIQDAWDEPIIEVHTYCSVCNKDFGMGPDAVDAVGDHIADNMLDGGPCVYDYYSKDITVGTNHHDAVTEQNIFRSLNQQISLCSNLPSRFLCIEFRFRLTYSMVLLQHFRKLTDMKYLIPYTKMILVNVGTFFYHKLLDSMTHQLSHFHNPRPYNNTCCYDTRMQNLPSLEDYQFFLKTHPIFDIL